MSLDKSIKHGKDHRKPYRGSKRFDPRTEGEAMLAIGNNELGDLLGDNIRCPHCGEMHAIEHGTTRRLVNDRWEDIHDRLLQFYRCGEQLYLGGINGRALKKKP